MSDETQNEPPSPQAGSRQILKLLVDLGPLVAFFAAYSKFGIYPATVTLMVATIAALGASKLLLGRVAIMPIITAVLVVVFGGLTIWLQDARFIKMKPTFLYIMFASVLFFGLYTGRLFLKYVFGEAFRLTEKGWWKLTVRWIGFCLFLALANEIVWRWFPEETWVQFKVFGILPLTLVFGLAQVGLLKRYELPNN